MEYRNAQTDPWAAWWRIYRNNCINTNSGG